MNYATIMIVEDSSDLRNTLRHAFEDRGYLTWTCGSPQLADSIFDSIRPSVVILDLDFEDAPIPELLALLDTWRAQAPQTRIVVESAARNAEQVRQVMDHGALAFLTKPYAMDPLFQLLEDNPPPSGPQPHLTRAA